MEVSVQCAVSVWEDDYVLEMDVGDGLQDVNVLKNHWTAYLKMVKL